MSTEAKPTEAYAVALLTAASIAEMVDAARAFGTCRWITSEWSTVAKVRRYMLDQCKHNPARVVSLLGKVAS